ncbi:MAG: hypothetical protein MK078_08015 [Crocinitomicaceae bacterium]|nr:hypothetical protein [Crocinitomicaceae bacterium]
MSGIIDINEGRTNNYLIHGVGLVILSLFLLAMGLAGNLIFLLPALGAFIFAVLLFGATNGVEFDIDNSRYRVYGKIGTRKTGIWKKLVNPQMAVLAIYTDNSSTEFAPAMGVAMPTQRKVTTYDLQVIDDLGEKHSIHDFLKYSVARKALKAVEEGYSIPVKDKIAEKLISNMNKPRR